MTEKICFITTNRYKFREVSDILKEFDIKIEHLDMDYEENHELGDVEDIAKSSAIVLSKKINKPFFIEDTGLCFEAYKAFPGVFPKFVINAIGYDGIFRLLKDKNRSALFKAAVAYCEPNKNPVTFTGILKGKISEVIENPNIDCFGYDRIFIPEGYPNTISNFLDKKNEFSHRAMAIRELGKYLKEKTIYPDVVHALQHILHQLSL